MKSDARLPIGPEASDKTPAASRCAYAEVGRLAGRTVFAVFGPRGLREVVFDEAELAGHERTVRAPEAIASAFDRYFAGTKEAFADVPLDVHGTAFQMRVWQELRRIPHGEVATYGEIAARIGVPRGMRAVGAANGENPVAIVVPCHRVVEARFGLGGYSGGLDVKCALLELEGARIERGRVHVGQTSLFGPDPHVPPT